MPENQLSWFQVLGMPENQSSWNANFPHFQNANNHTHPCLRTTPLRIWHAATAVMMLRSRCQILKRTCYQIFWSLQISEARYHKLFLPRTPFQPGVCMFFRSSFYKVILVLRRWILTPVFWIISWSIHVHCLHSSHFEHYVYSVPAFKKHIPGKVNELLYRMRLILAKMFLPPE